MTNAGTDIRDRNLDAMVEGTLRSARISETQLQLLVLGIAVTAAALVVGWLLVKDRSTLGTPPATAVPALVSEAQLARTAETLHHALYWAGPQDGMSYELTLTSDGRAFVRYLPKGVGAGDPRPNFLTIATYPGHSFGELRRAGNRLGAVSLHVARRGLVVFAEKKPMNVYLAYPESKLQIEVFAPDGDFARVLALTGKIVRVTA